MDKIITTLLLLVVCLELTFGFNLVKGREEGLEQNFKVELILQ